MIDNQEFISWLRAQGITQGGICSGCGTGISFPVCSSIHEEIFAYQKQGWWFPPRGSYAIVYCPECVKAGKT